MRFFTSDLHINSTNILKYAKRPFSNWKEAATKLIENCNEVAKEGDVIIHVGDLIMTSTDRHDIIEDVVPEGAYSAKSFKKELDADFITLTGNHDDGHSFEADAKSMMLDLNQNYKEVFVTHYPSDNPKYRGRTCANWSFGRGINLCGHVHDKWLLRYDSQKKILNINVGVDCWSYKPIKDSQLTELLDFIKNAKVKMPKDTLTVDEFLEWFEMNKKHVEAERIFRKNARYAKKGLTPEECERRKLEAMKKKGLIK